ncbi:MAG TPA: DUF3618 domain-containing protein [Gemmataceae bacterium]|jgi:ElaB/YqjD/DUF883 family membrane-anchored ribosome-binding protein|nr:DUF3618 domain-containing protein [Gemmataceae bacterium]
MTVAAASADPTPEDIQHDMETTRAHLGAGVKALEDKAVGYAHDAAEAVEDAYQGTKDALHAARDAVQHAASDVASVGRHAVADVAAFAGQAVDIRHHVRQYPWPAVGTAVAIGFACGRLIGRR